MIKIHDETKVIRELESIDDQQKFDAGSLPEMCETARIIADEMMADEMTRQSIVDSITLPLVESIYDELMIHDNFDQLPPLDDMTDLIARSLAILMPDLVKRVFQRELGVPRDTGEY